MHIPERKARPTIPSGAHDGCRHVWEDHRKHEQTQGEGDRKRTVRIVYVLKCLHCGDLKNHEIEIK